jgi:hypothetical protein
MLADVAFRSLTEEQVWPNRAKLIDQLEDRLAMLADDSDATNRLRAAETRPAAATPARHRSGRPRRTDKGLIEKVVAALRKHHGYDDGSVTNYEPAKNTSLAKKYDLANNALTRFLAAKYPGQRKPYRSYAAACRSRLIGAHLRLWSGELPMHATRLLPHESGLTDAG